MTSVITLIIIVLMMAIVVIKMKTRASRNVGMHMIIFASLLTDHIVTISLGKVTTQYRGPNEGNVVRQLEIPQNW